MVLETTMRPRAAFQQLGRLPNQLPHLWPELGTEVKRQMACSWAQLIVHLREEQDLEVRHDRSRYR
jgi:hypothetical protein